MRVPFTSASALALLSDDPASKVEKRVRGNQQMGKHSARCPSLIIGPPSEIREQ